MEASHSDRGRNWMSGSPNVLRIRANIYVARFLSRNWDISKNMPEIGAGDMKSSTNTLSVLVSVIKICIRYG